jgi:CubicO group peptidase (beta-lactamase class C family)
MVGSGLLMLVGLLAGGCGLFQRPSLTLYEDPQGRFTMEVDPDWEQVETDGSYAQFSSADPAMQVYLLVLDAGTVDEAFAQAFGVLGFDPGLLQGGGFASLGDWEAYTQRDAADLTYALAAQVVGDQAYVYVVKADEPGLSPEGPSVTRALMSIEIVGSGADQAVIETYPDLEAMVRRQVDGLSGSASLAAIHQGELAYTYAYGEADPISGTPADTETIYRYGSMTKPFTAAALMQLVEQGRVDLDAWPGEYVPGFPEQWHVTVRQLLDHSACMPDVELMVRGLIALRGESLPSLEEVFADYVEAAGDLTCEPGQRSTYANAHYLTLGRIIEEVSGEPYEAYVIDHLLTPLGMQATHFQLVEAEERYAKGQYPSDNTAALVAQLSEFRGSGQEAYVLQEGESFSTINDFRLLPPWGGLLGTPSDLTPFLQMFLDDGRYGDVQVLKPETVAAMEEMQPANDGSPLGLGLSWWIGEDAFGRYLFHDGGGPTIETTMRFYPDLELGVVVMGSVNGYRAGRIADALVSALLHERGLAP